MEGTLLFIVAGGLLILMALMGSIVKRLPLTAAILYLGVGFALGPAGLELIRLDPLVHSATLERVTEIAVLISLFTTGLKLRVPLRDRRWLIPLRLASVSMVLTIGMIAAAGILLLGLSPGAAILLGAILAPTDPVLASDVQVTNPFDRDRTRFALSAEAGLNDGSAFPFVMLGLALLKAPDFSAFALHWIAVDLLWATAAGLGIGWLLGLLTGYLVLYIRREHKEAVGLDDFLALGLIALSYGLALLAHSYGFLAVFAAGLALRRIEMENSGPLLPRDVQAMAEEGAKHEIATHPEKGPAYMTHAVLAFNEQIERMAEVAIVVLLGAMLSSHLYVPAVLILIPLLLLVIRPIATFVGLIGSRTPRIQISVMGWFGIRGVGSLYYLMFAIQHGLPPDVARFLSNVTLLTVTASILVHGVSVTPLMNLYERRRRKGRDEAAAP